jgi:hypothetical protein
LDTEIHSLAQQLCDKLLAQVGTENRILEITGAYSCFTSDVISEYCFGERFGFLDQDSFEPNFRRAVYSILEALYIFRFFPWLKALLLITP